MRPLAIGFARMNKQPAAFAALRSLGWNEEGAALMSCRRDDRVKKARGSKPARLMYFCRADALNYSQSGQARLLCVLYGKGHLATLLLRRSYQSRSHVN